MWMMLGWWRHEPMQYSDRARLDDERWNTLMAYSSVRVGEGEDDDDDSENDGEEERFFFS